MPSPAPAVVIRADVNGTGVLVDLTEWVRAEDRLSATAGRSDPYAPEPNAGELTFTLDNTDGRFTPGSISAYRVGLQKGVTVEWSCGGRTRRFRVESMPLSFPTGRGGQATVTVTATDSLALLAGTQLSSMLVEQTLLLRPLDHWPLADTGLPPDGVLTSATEQVQWVKPTARLTAGLTSTIGWAEGTGPSSDGVGAMRWRTQVSPPIPVGVDSAGVEITGPFLSPVSEWPPGQIGGLSLWLNVDPGIYGSLPAPTAVNDGPFVLIAYVDKPRITILWRPSDSGLFYFGDSNSEVIRAGTLPPGVTHHLTVMFGWEYDGAMPAQSRYFSRPRTWVNGVPLSISGDKFWESSQIDASPTSRVFIGSLGSSGVAVMDPPAAPVAVGLLPSGQTGMGTHPWFTGFCGTIGHVSIWDGGSVVVWSDSPNGGVPVWPSLTLTEVYAVGMGTVQDTAGQRVARLHSYVARRYPALGLDLQGTPDPALILVQDTAGGSALSAVAEAMAGEVGQLDTVTTGSVDRLRAWMGSTQRPVTPAVTISAQADAMGAPVLSWDASGSASEVAVTTRQTTVRVRDWDAPSWRAGTSTEIEAALSATSELVALGQHRAWRSRTVTAALSSITVDTRVADADLGAALIAVTPGARVRVTDLPAAIGVTTLDGWVSAITEEHSQSGDLYTLTLEPVPGSPEVVTDPLDGSADLWCRAAEENPTATGANRLTLTLATTSTTAATVTLSGAPGLSRDAGDYPMAVDLLQATTGAVERATIASIPGVPSTTQTITLTRAPVVASRVSGGCVLSVVTGVASITN